MATFTRVAAAAPHRGAYAMHHEPRRLLRDAQGAVDLV